MEELDNFSYPIPGSKRKQFDLDKQKYYKFCTNILDKHGARLSPLK